MLIRDAKPELEEDALKQRAIVIAAMIEGMMLMIGTGDADREHVRNLCAAARVWAVRIATDP